MFPPTSLLVATDFSPASRAAVALAGWLGRRCNAEVHLLYVLDPQLSAAATQAGVNLVADARRELAAFAAAVPQVAPKALRRHVVVGEPLQGVLDVAHRERADLIVIGTRGTTAGAPLGSTAQQVLRVADRPVLVVPPGFAPPDDPAAVWPDPLVMAIDRTEPALIATRAASALARRLGADMEAVHVVPALPALDRWKAHADRAVAESVRRAEGEMPQLVRPVTSPAVITTRITSGDVAEALASLPATAGRRPLLMLGRRGRHAPDGAPGATAERVASLAGVPVLMYRDSAGNGEPRAFSR